MDIRQSLMCIFVELRYQKHVLFLVSVVGDADEIDWFSPNGEKLIGNHKNLRVHKRGKSRSSVIVLNADLEHAGIYKCVARNRDAESRATAKLEILCKYLRHYF